MDPDPTPFPGKNQPTKPNLNRKPREASKPISTEPSVARLNRVFGTVRNANIPLARTLAAGKPAIKPSTKAPLRKQPEWNPTTRVPIPEPAKKKKNSSFENPKLKPKPNPFRVEEEEAVAKEKTPIARVETAVASPSPSPQAKSGGSAYQSAEICSKCRFDRLETASYWLGQIKLSESVGKHFVSAAFFRLAFESKAEPIRKLRFELKRYLGRNGHVGEHSEWREVCVSYGILKDEKMTIERFDSIIEKLETPKSTRVGFDQEIEATNAQDEQHQHAFVVNRMKEIEI